MAALKVEVLGGFRLTDGETGELHIRGAKTKALFAYLVLNPDRPHERETLASVLWGDRFDSQARQSLRQSLLAIRKVLGERAGDVLTADSDTVTLNSGSVAGDAAEFERLGSTESGYEASVALYAGDLLAGINPKAEEYDTWRAAERDRLRNLACTVSDHLADRFERAGDSAKAVDATRRLLDLDPLREDAHRRLMRLYAVAGDRDAAFKQYQSFANTLRRELGADPEAETDELFAKLKVGATATVEDLFEAEAESSDEERARQSPALPDKPSIAVLPFDNMSSDPEQDYFSDGITEELTTALSKNTLFFVTARNSAFTYKGKPVNVKQVARELGVRYILEGSVRKAGDRVRISAQFIDAVTGNHVWAERFDRPLLDVFAVQDEITREIAGAIGSEFVMAEEDRASRLTADSLSAWELVVRARGHYWKMTKEDVRKGRLRCEEAIEKTPGDSRGYSVAALAHTADAVFGWSESRDRSVSEARRLSEKAVSLNPNDEWAHCSEAYALYMSREFEPAIRAAEEAIRINPNFATAEVVLGFILAMAGRSDEASEHIHSAMRLSPRDPMMFGNYVAMSLAEFVRGDYGAAADWARKAIQANRAYPGSYRILAACCGHSGELNDAKNAIHSLRQYMPFASIEGTKRQIPFKNDADSMRYLDGLRKAGLPEN